MVTDSFFDPYDDKFLLDHRGESFTAFRVGWNVWELFEPRSVIDIGCASGYMLRGVYDASTFTAEILGVDGPPVVERLRSLGLADIPIEKIVPYDLRNLDEMAWDPSWARRAFDLCICTETGEHLPESSADLLVDLVTSLAPRVLWSAAHEGQGGTAHLTERPHEFWREKFELRQFRLNEDRTGDLLNRLGPMAQAPWFRCLMIYERVP